MCMWQFQIEIKTFSVIRRQKCSSVESFNPTPTTIVEKQAMVDKAMRTEYYLISVWDCHLCRKTRALCSRFQIDYRIHQLDSSIMNLSSMICRINSTLIQNSCSKPDAGKTISFQYMYALIV